MENALQVMDLALWLENPNLTDTPDVSFVVDGELNQELVTGMFVADKNYKILENKIKALKSEMLRQMIHAGIKKIDTETFTATVIEEGTREQFNQKKFKEEQPDMFDEYVEIKTTLPQLRFRKK